MNKRLFAFIIVLIFFVIVAAPPTAAQPGDIQIGGITRGSMIYGFHHEVNGSGCSPQATCHSRFTLSIVKPLDDASPRFLQAVATGKIFRTVLIRYPQSDSSSYFYSIRLTNAKIVDDVQSFDPLSLTQPAIGPLETITFEFERISWQWESYSPICWDLTQYGPCLV